MDARRLREECGGLVEFSMRRATRANKEEATPSSVDDGRMGRRKKATIEPKKIYQVLYVFQTNLVRDVSVQFEGVVE